MDMLDGEPVMQPRCVHCYREQYAFAVLDVSNGDGPCAWCGKVSRKMTMAEYQAALRPWHLGTLD